MSLGGGVGGLRIKRMAPAEGRVGKSKIKTEEATRIHITLTLTPLLLRKRNTGERKHTGENFIGAQRQKRKSCANRTGRKECRKSTLHPKPPFTVPPYYRNSGGEA